MKRKKLSKYENIFPKKSAKENSKKFYKILALICWSFIPIYLVVFLYFSKEFNIGYLVLLKIPFSAGKCSLKMSKADSFESIWLLLKYADSAMNILKNYI